MTDGRSGATRASYDQAAATYADRFRDELTGKPLDRALLAAFAERAGTGARVLDLGCGPGHVTAHLAGLGLAASGLDLSPGMVEVARAAHPELAFTAGSMLDLDGRSFDGAVALYSLIHFERADRQRALARIHALLAPGAPLLLAVHEGDEVHHVEELWGVPLDLDFHFLDVDELRRDVVSAGFVVEAVLRREPYPGVETTQRAYLLAGA